MSLKGGSLFDGIAGFPLAGSRVGFDFVWASEIEPFPIRVSSHHFPRMRHLGSVTEVRGNEIEPVDLITFGSPCQDLSVAGKRAGFDGTRSGLFFEALRVIGEMREATNGRYPQLVLWENVPGALSSNAGRDFAAALRELAELGAVDIAWRVLDAQWFGVAQRRARIFLVADFGGERAAQVLFESSSVRRDTPPSRTQGEGVASTLAAGLGHHGHSSPRGDGSDNLIPSLAASLAASGTYDRGDGNDNIVLSFDWQCGPSVEMAIDESTVGALVCKKTPAVAFQERGREDGRSLEWQADLAYALTAPDGGGRAQERNIALPYGVRRLTPRECERLQGYPDDWTALPGAADAPRYKALGNSVAVPVVEWILERAANALSQVVEVAA